MNILLISSIYPLPTVGNRGTKVCHYFAKEWQKQSHNVLSIHIQAVYPLPLYLIAKVFRKRIAAKSGAVVYTERDKGDNYEMDGVPVLRIPVYKPIPHGPFSRRSIRKAVSKIISNNHLRKFVPDLIIAHFPNPQIEILSILKQKYPNTPNALIMHGDIGLTQKVYGTRLPMLMKAIDVWGFRNKGDKAKFYSQIAQVKSFMCYSGVPEDYVAQDCNRSFEGGVKSFIFVGEMIERKYPLSIIDALYKSYAKGDYHLDYVGDGFLMDILRRKVSSLKINEEVTIHGRVPRERIKELYDQADCMIMISAGEAYGLVYLEAMARGCITIASKGEGFDGVIVDGVNGFLCEAGNVEELIKVLERIRLLSPDQLRRISLNAWNTAKKLTDSLAAKHYLDAVLELINY